MKTHKKKKEEETHFPWFQFFFFWKGIELPHG